MFFYMQNRDHFLLIAFNICREPPPPAPVPVGGGVVKMPPPTLQITLHDENNQQQCLMGGMVGRASDLSPVSEEDLVGGKKGGNERTNGPRENDYF